jgi:ACT domain-containing protein
MIMLVDTDKMSMEFTKLGELLQQEAEALGVDIRLQREEIFTSMHRI